MTNALIVSAARTPIGRSHRGSLATVRPDDLAAVAIKTALERAPGLDPADIDDVIMGCAMPEAEQGLNVGRIAAIRAGLPHSVSAQTVNRFCSSGLQTIALGAQQIMSGMGEVVLAGGTESMSMVSMAGNVYAPNPVLTELHPEVYMPMGLTAEEVANRYGISREDQDAFALRSHQFAAAAIDSGKFSAEIAPVDIEIVRAADGGGFKTVKSSFAMDEGVRRDTSLEALAKLKPAFAAKGSVTAGNSSQTSDGAAAVVLMSSTAAEARGLKPLARFVSFAVGGVDPEVMGIGPTVAIPKALKLAGLTLDQIDLFELNEAFAAQALAVVRTLGIDLNKVNVNGGAIALGHPLGCTGAKLTVQLISELKRRNARYGMVTMCIGGGMGAAGIFENVN
jgi:acetyl-CoA acyltransferase